LQCGGGGTRNNGFSFDGLATLIAQRGAYFYKPSLNRPAHKNQPKDREHANDGDQDCIFRQTLAFFFGQAMGRIEM
jgi:hypothetical protein